MAGKGVVVGGKEKHRYCLEWFCRKASLAKVPSTLQDACFENYATDAF